MRNAAPLANAVYPSNTVQLQGPCMPSKRLLCCGGALRLLAAGQVAPQAGVQALREGAGVEAVGNPGREPALHVEVVHYL